MKKIFIILLLTMMYLPIFAQSSEESYQEIRKLIYSVKPVEKVREKTDKDLVRLGKYALLNKEGKLTEDDQILGMFLCTFEEERRAKSPDDFSLYLQEQHEAFKAWLAAGQVSELAYIKIDTWLDLFKLNLMFD